MLLIAGTVPGVIAGSVIRVELLSGPRVFDLVIAAVLIPLGSWLALTRPPHADPGESARQLLAPVLLILAVIVGCIGGIYGIGGATYGPVSAEPGIRKWPHLAVSKNIRPVIRPEPCISSGEPASV